MLYQIRQHWWLPVSCSSCLPDMVVQSSLCQTMEGNLSPVQVFSISPSSSPNEWLREPHTSNKSCCWCYMYDLCAALNLHETCAWCDARSGSPHDDQASLPSLSIQYHQACLVWEVDGRNLMAPVIPQIKSPKVGSKLLAYLIRPELGFGGIASAVTPGIISYL